MSRHHLSAVLAAGLVAAASSAVAQTEAPSPDVGAAPAPAGETPVPAAAAAPAADVAPPPPAAPSPRIEVASPSASASPSLDRPRLIVMELGGTLPDQQRTALTGLVTASMGSYGVFDVISAADVRAMVELEGERQKLGCEDTTSCLAEVAGAMGARYVMFGDVTALGSRVLFNLSLFDSEAGTAIARSSRTGNSVDALTDQVPAAVREIASPVLVSLGRTPPPVDPPPTALTSEPPPPVEPDEPGSMTPLIAGSVLGVGGLLLVSGVVWELVGVLTEQTWTSNKELDPLDVVGPALVTGGVIVAVASGALFFIPVAE